jgi:hypothetical protein
LEKSALIPVCRAISTSDHNNNMWDLVSSVNTVRNALSHSLDANRRSKAIQNLRAIYEHQFKDMPNATNGIPNNIEKEIPADTALCLYAISSSLGYLHAHLAEVKRLKSIIIGIDTVMNKGALQRS